MTANLTDKLQKVAANTVTTLASPGKSVGASSINVATTANFPTTTGITIAIRTVDNNGELVAGTYTEFTATVASGTSFTIDPTPVLGTDQIYAAGSTTQVYMPVSSSSYNTMIDGLLVSHDQDGTLKAGAVDNAACLATGIVGWDKLDNTAAVSFISGGSGLSIIAAGSTTYIGLFGAETVSSYLVPIPIDGVLSDLVCFTNGCPGVDKHYTFTLMVNNVATSLTCDIPYDTSQGSDYTHSVPVPATARISIRVVTTAGATEYSVKWAAKFVATH